MSEATAKKVEDLMKITDRSLSDLVRHLIKKEWAEINGVDWKDDQLDENGNRDEQTDHD